MKVHNDLFQSQLQENETFEKVLENVGWTKALDDCDVGDLVDAICKREEPLVGHWGTAQKIRNKEKTLSANDKQTET